MKGLKSYFGAMADGVTDDTSAILDAIEYSESVTSAQIETEPGIFRVTQPIVFPNGTGSNHGFIGSGDARYGSNFSGSTFLIDHDDGPGVHIRASGQRLEKIIIKASPDRAVASRGNNYGILFEPNDAAGAVISGAVLSSVTIVGQPYHAIVTSGGLFMPTFDGISLLNNKGHGIIIDGGAVTDRVNRDRPGGGILKHIRTYGNTGHSLVIGLGYNGDSDDAFNTLVNQTSLGAYRFVLIDADLDCGAADLDNTLPYGFVQGYNSVIKGDSIEFHNAAYGCHQSAANLIPMWLSGWNHKHIGGRYIGCGSVAKIKATPSFHAESFDFDNNYTDSSIGTAIVGEDTGSSQCLSVSWSGSTSNISTVASGFDYITISATSRFSDSRETLVQNTMYLGQTTTTTPGVGNQTLGGAVSANGRNLYLSNSGAHSISLNRNTNNGPILEGRRAGSLIGTLDVTTTWMGITQGSDYRLKENVKDLEGAGNFIDSLRPVEYDMRGEHTAGFLAHELQDVCPSAVTGEKDAVDEKGEPIYQRVNYGSPEFTVNIFAELQSLRKRVALLECDDARIEQE